MLVLYVNTKSEGVQFYNDIFFDLNLGDIVVDENIKKIMFEIDGARYAGNNHFYSKYGDVILSLDSLSTGCKTAINVYTFSNKIFYVGECGDNALAIICMLGKGNIYTNKFFNTLPFNNSMRVICSSRGVDCVVNNDMELRTLLFNIYSERR